MYNDYYYLSDDNDDGFVQTREKESIQFYDMIVKKEKQKISLNDECID